jgi:hypothetical protein
MTAKVPHFRGVFMRNTLPPKIHNKECGVINLDSSEGDGTHWVAYYKSGENRIYFDSFGLDPPNEVKKYLSLPLLTQTYQLQKTDDVTCGHLCVFVLKELTSGKQFNDIINALWISY